MFSFSKISFSIKLAVKQDNISNIRIIPEKDSDKNKFNRETEKKATNQILHNRIQIYTCLYFKRIVLLLPKCLLVAKKN